MASGLFNLSGILLLFMPFKSIRKVSFSKWIINKFILGLRNTFLASVNSNDVKINNKLLYKPDFIANMGRSGGPLFKANQLIGLLLFGFPADSIIKKEVFAISANEIISVLNPKNFAQH